jgi:hypothetical protein
MRFLITQYLSVDMNFAVTLDTLFLICLGMQKMLMVAELYFILPGVGTLIPVLILHLTA